MYRVVETDNHGSDYPNESFVGPCFRNEYAAQMVADLINEDAGWGGRASRFWKVVPEDYKLQPGFEP